MVCDPSQRLLGERLEVSIHDQSETGRTVQRTKMKDAKVWDSVDEAGVGGLGVVGDDKVIAIGCKG